MSFEGAGWVVEFIRVKVIRGQDSWQVIIKEVSIGAFGSTVGVVVVGNIEAVCFTAYT